MRYFFRHEFNHVFGNLHLAYFVDIPFPSGGRIQLKQMIIINIFQKLNDEKGVAGSFPVDEFGKRH